MKQRITEIDSLKGLLILFVIIAHTQTPVLSRILYSCTLPPFFVISGMFAKAIPDYRQAIQRNLRLYIKPYLITCIIVLALLLVCYSAGIGVDIPNYLVNILSFGVVKFINIGPTWFLVALFWSLTIYEIAKARMSSLHLGIFCLLMSSAAVCLSMYIDIYFVWAVQGLTVLPLLYTGDMIFHHKDRFDELMSHKLIVSLMTIVYLFVLIDNQVVLAFMYLPTGFLTIISSVCVCCIMIWKCKMIDCKVLQYIGKHTLLVLCVHTVFLQLRDRCGNPFPMMFADNYVRIPVEILGDAFFSLFVSYIIIRISEKNKLGTIFH